MERAEYNRMAAVEDSMWWYRALHDGLIDRLGWLSLTVGACVLDAGCGTGGLLRRIGQTMPGLERIGVEYDAQAAGIAAAKSGAAVLGGTVNAMPFPAGKFDAIVSADVLCHRRVDEAAALAEFHRCLQPGGSLLLNLPAYAFMKSIHDRRVDNSHRYTATGARRLVEKAGFRVVGSGYWNSLLFPPMLLHRLTTGRISAESDLRVFPAWLDRLFYAIFRVERRMASVGLRLPFGGSVWIWAVKLERN
jgi:SAM-dependent methyltransferase